MAVRGRMTHRARVERNVATELDAYGNVQAPTWVTHLSAQPCYYWQPSVQTGEQQGERNYLRYGHATVLPLDTDITETDRITGFTDRLGNTVAAGTFAVIALVRKPDHLLLMLEVIA